MATRELVRTEEPATDLFVRKIGPHQLWMPGPVVFYALCDGDRISSLRSAYGFGHKGLERRLERTPWQSAIPLVDRLDSESAVFAEWAYSSAIEQIVGIRVPDRAQWVRVLLLELSRIVSHLRFGVRISRSVGAETPAQYMLRDSERFLDLIEHLTGTRYNPNYICPGGIRDDVTDGFVERSIEACDALFARTDEYRRVLLNNASFLKRASNCGVLSANHAEASGVTGSNLRASGFSHDLRKQRSGSLGALYSPLEFDVPIGNGQSGRLGDVADRVSVRFREIVESVRIVQQAAPRIPKGEFRVPLSEKTHGHGESRGEAYVEVESPRGVLGCYVQLAAEQIPTRVHFHPASAGAGRALEYASRGIALDDFRLLVASFDLSPAEVDR